MLTLICSFVTQVTGNIAKNRYNKVKSTKEQKEREVSLMTLEFVHSLTTTENMIEDWYKNHVLPELHKGLKDGAEKVALGCQASFYVLNEFARKLRNDGYHAWTSNVGINGNHTLYISLEQNPSILRRTYMFLREHIL